MGLFKRINRGLKKTRDSMSGAINAALFGKNEIDDDFNEELEEILVMADVGVTTATEIVDRLKDSVFKKNLRKAKDVKENLQIGGGELPVAINRALHNLRQGEQIQIITPWYMAYGVEGTSIIKPYSNLRIVVKVAE